MIFPNEGISYKQRAFDILAHETHFHNVSKTLALPPFNQTMILFPFDSLN